VRVAEAALPSGASLLLIGLVEIVQSVLLASTVGLTETKNVQLLFGLNRTFLSESSLKEPEPFDVVSVPPQLLMTVLGS
jgi:hypothetical protein